MCVTQRAERYLISRRLKFTSQFLSLSWTGLTEWCWRSRSAKLLRLYCPPFVVTWTKPTFGRSLLCFITIRGAVFTVFGDLEWCANDCQVVVLRRLHHAPCLASITRWHDSSFSDEDRLSGSLVAVYHDCHGGDGRERRRRYCAGSWHGLGMRSRCSWVPEHRRC